MSIKKQLEKYYKNKHQIFMLGRIWQYANLIIMARFRLFLLGN